MHRRADSRIRQRATWACVVAGRAWGGRGGGSSEEKIYMSRPGSRAASQCVIRAADSRDRSRAGSRSPGKWGRNAHLSERAVSRGDLYPIQGSAVRVARSRVCTFVLPSATIRGGSSRFTTATRPRWAPLPLPRGRGRAFLDATQPAYAIALRSADERNAYVRRARIAALRWLACRAPRHDFSQTARADDADAVIAIIMEMIAARRSRLPSKSAFKRSRVLSLLLESAIRRSTLFFLVIPDIFKNFKVLFNVPFWSSFSLELCVCVCKIEKERECIIAYLNYLTWTAKWCKRRIIKPHYLHMYNFFDISLIYVRILL